MFFGAPIALTKDHITATNIPVVLPAWEADTIYPVGAMVTRGGRAFISALTEAASYRTGCDHLYNRNQDPILDPPPYVPTDDEDEEGEPCVYLQAGMAWWAEIDPALTYAEATLNYNEFNQAQVPGDLSLTVAPPESYDMVGIFGVWAQTATLTIGGESVTQDLFLFDRDNPPDPFPYGDHVRHSNRTVWLLAEETAAPLTVTLADKWGHSALGNLVVARRNDFGTTYYQSEVGIRDYSRKERNDVGRVQLVPRWYQDLVRFIVSVPADRRFEARQALLNYKDVPGLYVGHDNPSRYELQVFGLLRDLSLPLPHSAFSIIDLEVEAVGVPKWVSGIPGKVIPPPPPKPPFPIGAPWLAVGHDEDPYITIVDTVTWQKIQVNFTIPGPARAVLFSSAMQYLFIGHECPPYFTVVRTGSWVALDLDPITADTSSSSSDAMPIGDLGTVFGLCQIPQGNRLAICHNCPPYLTVITVPDWRPVTSPEPLLPRSILRAVYSNNGDTLLVTDSCQYRWTLDGATYSTVTALEGQGRAGVFHWDNQHAILGYTEDGELSSGESSSSASYGHRVSLVSLQDWYTPARMVRLPGEPYIIKYTRDHKYIAVGHRCPPYVTIIDAVTWATVETFFTLEYSVCSLDFTFDGLYLAAVYKHHPYCTLIKTVNWTEFYLAFDELETETSE